METTTIEHVSKSKWILLKQDQGLINNLTSSSQFGLSAIQKVFDSVPVKSQAEFNAIASDLQSWVHSEMLKDEEVKKLTKMVDIENLKIPEHLQKVIPLFEKGIDFRFVAYSEGEGWSINEGKLNAAIENCKTYAKTPESVKRYKAIEAFCEMLNSINIGVHCKNIFVNEAIAYKDRKFCPDIDFVLADADKYMS